MPLVDKPTFDFPPTILPGSGCSYDKPITQSVMVAYMLSSLRYKFSVTENIFYEELKHLKWSDNMDESHIHITPSFHTAADDMAKDKFPRIVVTPSGMMVNQSTRPGISINTYHTGQKLHAGLNHYRELEGKITLNIVSRGDYESLLLAEDVFLWILTLENDIARDLKLTSLEVSVVEGPTQTEQYKDCYISTVPVMWISGMSWRSIADGPAFADSTVQ